MMFPHVRIGQAGRLLAGLLLVALASALGCGNNFRNVATVNGTVTLDGKPVTAGRVSFTSPDNRVGSAQLDAQGKYAMKDAPVGEVTATVTVPKANVRTPKAPKGIGIMKPPPGAPPGPSEGEGASSTGGGMLIDPKLIVPVPEKYADAKTSGLKYTVQKGDQTIDIPLTK